MGNVMKKLCTLMFILILMCTCCGLAAAAGVTSVTISDKTLELEIGNTQTLTVKIKPSTASSGIIWTTSDETVVTVGEDGLVTAVGVGKASVTATSAENGKKSATCKITVTTPPTSIVLSEQDVQLAAGKTLKLKATQQPEAARKARATGPARIRRWRPSKRMALFLPKPAAPL